MIVPLNFPKPPNVTTPEAAMNVSLTEMMHWDLAPENPARLAKAGVRIAFTTQGLRDRDEFLKAVVENWRLTRPQAVVTCRCHGTRPTPEIVIEQSLRQAIVNLLNNAADASPEQVDVEGQWDERELCIRICDA